MSSEPESSSIGGSRQTQTYLKQLLEANGLRPMRQLGQNFLIDLNLIDLLANTADVGKHDVVLEVGAGTGGLTTRLALRAARVVAVEIDPGFHRLVSQEVEHMSNVRLIHADVLSGKNQINPLVISAVADAMREAEAPCYHLAANLPYDVASSVVANLMLHDLPIRSLTMTLQYEVGERMVANPGSRDYGPLSVLVQLVGRIQWVRTLGPAVFWPRPNVDSCIVRIDVDPEKRADLPRLRAAHQFIRNLFVHRRKTLRSAIASIPGLKRLKGELDPIIASLDLTNNIRAEVLSPQRLVELHGALAGILGAEPQSDDAGLDAS